MKSNLEFTFIHTSFITAELSIERGTKVHKFRMGIGKDEYCSMSPKTESALRNMREYAYAKPSSVNRDFSKFGPIMQEAFEKMIQEIRKHRKENGLV